MIKQLKGSLLIVLASLCFGSYGVFSKQLAHYDIFYLTFVRCFIIVAILLVVGVVTKQLKKIERKDYRSWAPILIATVFTITPITIAFRALPLGTASFLFYSSFTIFTYIFGKIFFKEKLGTVKIVSAIMALVGLVLVFSVDLHGLLLFPVLMAIFNGLASSAEVVSSKNVSDKYSTLQVTLMIFLAIGITHMALSFLVGENHNLELFSVSGGVITLFSLAAIFGVVTLYAGYRELDPSIGALVGLSEIVFSVLFGIILFKEQLSLTTLVGGAFIIVAAALPNIVELGRKSRTRT